MPNEPKPGQENVAEEKQPVEVTATEPTQDTDSLPEGVPERTAKEFEKLKQHNKELSEKIKALEATNQKTVFDELRPQETAPVPDASQIPGLTQPQVNQIYDNLVDKDGYIDERLLKQTLKQAQDEARQAQARTAQLEKRIENMEESAQVRVAHKKYPQLDPKSPEFDQKFFNEVKKTVVYQMVQGHRDLLQAADEVAELYYKNTPSKQAEEVAQKKEEQVAQANVASGASVKTARFTQADTNEIVKAMQHGSRDALLERLKRAGY
jgi:hypothetical protein